MKRALLLFTTMLCAVFFTMSGPSLTIAEEGNWPVHLRFLSGPNGGQWYIMGDPIAEALTAAVLPTTSRIGGGLSNIESVNQKMGDLAFTLTGFLGAAASKEAEYINITLENTALLANVYPQVLYFLLRKDFANEHNITDVETLLKAEMPLRFATLRPGTASEFILSLVLKYGYDTNFDNLRKQGWTIYFNNYAETADNFVAGTLDCFAYTAGTNVPLIHTIEEYTDVLILPMSQDVLDKLSDKFKTTTYIIPPGAYKSVTTPVTTLGDYTSIIVRKDLPEHLVYNITKALWQSRDAIAAIIADFGALTPETAIAPGMPMHPGALRFWEEQLAGK